LCAVFRLLGLGLRNANAIEPRRSQRAQRNANSVLFIGFRAVLGRLV
jgi:hypothetical protein